MISFLKTRIAASLLTVAIVAQPHLCHAVAAATAGSTASQLKHILIVRMGKGSPVFLTRGLLSPSAVWDGVAPAIAKTHTVYLFQLNGFGGSDAASNQ